MKYGVVLLKLKTRHPTAVSIHPHNRKETYTTFPPPPTRIHRCSYPVGSTMDKARFLFIHHIRLCYFPLPIFYTSNRDFIGH